MLDIMGVLVAPSQIVSAEVETRHYANGSASFLVVKLTNGRTLRREHGYGFDVHKTLDRIREGSV